MKKTEKPKLKLDTTRIRELTKTEQASVDGAGTVPRTRDGDRNSA